MASIFWSELLGDNTEEESRQQHVEVRGHGFLRPSHNNAFHSEIISVPSAFPHSSLKA